ncbi:MAG TPA: Ig-like domain-containing protein, partial [Candidatus Angelobacter sp.]|nr:Ig-like domain-containing protein [Candidatus Angelobacter sp.]
PSLTDLADRLIDNPGSFTFQTGNATDNSTPAVATVSPSNGAGNVPGNTVVELQFSKAIDPLTVTSATLQLIPGTIGGSGSVTAGGNPIAGTVTVSSNGLSATFIPASPLVLGTSYVVEATPGVSDLEGHGLASFASAFITGVSSSGAGLAVQRISPQNGDTSVPVNVLVVARFNSPIEPLSVGSGAIAVSTGSVNVAGTVQLMSDRMGLVFTPNSPLSANTAYSVAVSGFADATGTVVTPFTSSFTTRSSTASDSGNPQVVSVSPTNGATGVAVNSNVVLTFNENVAATSVSASTVQVNVAGGSGSVAGSYAVAGPVVTFTPLSPLPAAASMQVVVTQLESEATVNTPPPSSNTFSSSFTTTGGTDTAVPSVLSVSPVNGATNIGLNATAVVTFSKSLNPGTIGGNTFALYANGAVLGSTIAVSADNRTVTLTPTSTLPASSTVTVIVTSGVRDFYGNALSDFRSQFTTAPNFDVISARVASQRPASGASGVPLGSSIVLFVNEPLSQATIANSLHVSQNGVIGQGTTTSRDNGQTIEFVPTAPWLNNALVQVFLDSTAIDTDGTPVVAYQGSFRTALDTTSTAPTVVAISPPDGLPAASVARNAVIDVQYNEPLDPGTVGTNTVLLQNDTANKAIEGTVFLDPTGTIARLVPTIPLDAGSHYHVSTTVGILGLNGLSQAAAFNSLGFSTASTTDTTAPTIALVSPPDGSLGVPVNANIRVRFSKQIDVLTANASNIQISGGGQTVTATSISFSNNNQDVLITPQEPFPDNTQMAITVSGVNDLAGNPVVAQTTRFTTGAVPAAVAPVVVAANPSSGELGVSVNAVIAIQTNVPVDAGSLTSLSMVVNDTSTSLPISGTTNVSADGKTVSFIPGAPLATFHTYQVLASSGIADFAGNQLSCPSLQLCSFSFTTAVSSTNGALAVTGVSPANGQTQVPINAQVMAQFSVPVNPLTLGQVTLTSTGGATQVSTQLINGNQTLLLFPLQPLTAGTSYTVTVAGAQDEAGNTLSPSFSSSFSTANGADLTGPPLVVSVTPFNNAQGAPVNTAIQLQFNKPVNRLTVTSASFQLLTQTGTSVNSAITFSPDGTIAILTPTSNLAFSTTYSVQTTSAIIGLTGQSLAPFTSRFTTASSAPAFNVVAVGPANLATGVAVNDLVSLLLSESVNGSSVGSNAIVVSTGGTPITGSIVLSTDRTGLTFTPTIPLAVNATYSVSASGFNDLSGNAIPAFNSSFTTGGSSVPDTTAPTVVSVSPVNGATGISAGAAIVLTFSKSIGPGSVNSSTVAVTVNGNPIAGSFAVSGSTVTFTPRLLLPSGAAINVSVSNVQDLAGNVTATFSSSFRTSGGGGGAS